MVSVAPGSTIVFVAALIGWLNVRLCGSVDRFSKVTETWPPAGTLTSSGSNSNSAPVRVPIVSSVASPAGAPEAPADPDGPADAAGLADAAALGDGAADADADGPAEAGVEGATEPDAAGSSVGPYDHIEEALGLVQAVSTVVSAATTATDRSIDPIV